jgi:hypothetical protein
MRSVRSMRNRPSDNGNHSLRAPVIVATKFAGTQQSRWWRGEKTAMENQYLITQERDDYNN